ncbi:hypothetical protein EST38_g4769 [Candolleomyces aberdarensis]|uniref:Ribonuclease H1 N-terminal domain-containing protein n=1 Tax=Candolleomyces aberdarensis TaxID=2316362 RepID=A0A4Q2DM72_9AGAR|nr:hypothetical protein EST38_g4769 [Candolleomyces aberdarensis]
MVTLTLSPIVFFDDIEKREEFQVDDVIDLNAVLTFLSSKLSAADIDATKNAKTFKGKVKVEPAYEPAEGTLCRCCGVRTAALNSDDSWYAVTIGREVGVFQGWTNVQPLVSGVSGGAQKKYRTQQEAEQVFQQALDAGKVCIKN